MRPQHKFPRIWLYILCIHHPLTNHHLELTYIQKGLLGAQNKGYLIFTVTNVCTGYALNYAFDLSKWVRKAYSFNVATKKAKICQSTRRASQEKVRQEGVHAYVQHLFLRRSKHTALFCLTNFPICIMCSYTLVNNIVKSRYFLIHSTFLNKFRPMVSEAFILLLFI